MQQPKDYYQKVYASSGKNFTGYLVMLQWFYRKTAKYKELWQIICTTLLFAKKMEQKFQVSGSYRK